MKRSNKQIEEEVRKTLDLAERIRPVEPSAGFKSRIMARLEAETPPVRVNWWRKNRLAIAAAIALLLANAVTVMQYATTSDDPLPYSQEADAVAEAYNMTLDNNY